MTRAEKRDLRNNNKAFKELMKVIKHYFKDLLKKLNEVEDKRHQSYVTYTVGELLFTKMLGDILNLGSMREITDKFNNEVIISNIGKVLENSELTELPHGDTINDFLKILDPDELSKICKYMIKELLKKRCLERYRLLDKHWLIAVDATGIQSYRERHCKHCLKKVITNEKTGETKEIYYHNVLEAKLVVGDMVLSIGTEFIENEDKNVSKQDCERNAFYRLAKRLKKEYPRLPICILADSLYACGPVMDICKKNKWEYIIRFKEGSIKSVASEFNTLKTLNKDHIKTLKSRRLQQKYYWVNGIRYQEHEVNISEMFEEKKMKKGSKTTKFVYITSIIITTKNLIELVNSGRKRWKIENEGFNTQKNHGYNIEHMYSKDINAMKNHYLIIQMAHITRQLYEKGNELVKQLKMSMKKVSYELLLSLKTELTTEDTNYINNKRIQISFY